MTSPSPGGGASQEALKDSARDLPSPKQGSPEQLVVNGLGVAFRKASVLSHVDFTAKSGHITALLGNNGTGKTTLLRALCGLVDSSGEVMLQSSRGSIRLGDLDRTERARTIAYVPQRSQLDAALSVQEVVEMARYTHTQRGLVNANQSSVERALEATDMLGKRWQPFTELSGGEQRRTLIARALATDAPVLLLDEPTASLDLAHALSLFELLKQLTARGYLIIAALHRLADVLEYADRACVLDQGRIIASGPPAQVLSADLLDRVFGLQMLAHAAPAFRHSASADPRGN